VSDEKKPRRKRRPRSEASAAHHDAPIIDRRAMEKIFADVSKILNEQEFESIDEANAFLQQMLASGQPIAAAPETPLEQAQEVMYQAWESSGRQRVKLARRALDISPDCADAYVLLAEETAKTPQEAIDLYEQGVRAGERALGPEAFEQAAGHFWGIIETRPYMRAREGLAQTLWAMGERQQAIGHFRDMLRLNPGDNQGIRYMLALCLLEEDDDDALAALLEQYKDDASATWSYTRALVLFRRDGAGRRANAALKKALRYNAFVADYLLGRKRLPREMPELVGFGDESEAVAYAVQAIMHWHQTPGALDWLAGRQT
jgi:tetratricopeptide (TPR) repeat protein